MCSETAGRQYRIAARHGVLGIESQTLESIESAFRALGSYKVRTVPGGVNVFHDVLSPLRASALSQV